jgi:putative resolvase
VSSVKQKEDLHEIIQEIGYGVNFQRKGFQKLLDLACQGMFSKFVIMQRDRLYRFGHNLLEHIFQQFHTKILVHSQEEDNEWKSPEE